MKLDEFLARLRRGGYVFTTRAGYLADSTSVHAVNGQEAWSIEFHADGSTEVDVFGLIGAPTILDSGENLDLNLFFGRSERAWLEASEDLGIRFLHPLVLSSPSREPIHCTGLLPDFGGPSGTAIIGREAPEKADELAYEAGYCVSGLNPRYFDTYERELFINLLLDWGWFGDTTPPSWYRERGGSVPD